MADTTLSTLRTEVPERESLEDGPIGRLIHVVRGVQVMLDCDLAELYGVETKVFNQAVKRNEARFPSRFRFQLTADEYELLRSQTVTSKARGPQISSLCVYGARDCNAIGGSSERDCH